ncbi:hypothetical protein RvY_19106 [Ramazzottius varieornatus]|uniref:Uncharacterized protein n=1 Tax=Ramazzottius varieornatus TaxID=947166 RepID=A0A1D1W8A8_RAMVA|nr:hypothetical protein RvY_19106 [Ramazzottius varieornatus]
MKDPSSRMPQTAQKTKPFLPSPRKQLYKRGKELDSVRPPSTKERHHTGRKKTLKKLN